MRYVSLFSGVEAASVAWGKLGWTPLAFSEVDPFACAVLAHRFPDVQNLGDVCGIDWEEFHGRNGAIDVLIGGSPCQSFSIAGNREGLEGASRLMFEYVRAIRDLVRVSGGKSPRYILWENVPGCLSSGKGKDFECLLDELEDCGYFVGWRTLDSQFARVFDRSSGRFRGPVPQRRRRVFLVGSLGGPSAADILFERSCLFGNPPSGRKAREALAGEPAEGAGGSRCAGFKWFAGARAKGIGYEDGTSPTLSVSDGHTPAVLTPWDVQSKRIVSPSGISPSLQAGTGEGMNIQPIVMTTANTGANGSNVNMDGVSYTLDQTNSNAVFTQNTVAFEQNQRAEVRLCGGDGSVTGSLSSNPSQAKGQGMSLVCMSTGQAKSEVDDEMSPTLNAAHEQPIICIADDNGKAAVDENLCGSLKVGGGSPWIAAVHYVVRRLMPVECNRLQAFPDEWDDITGCDVDSVTEKVAEALKYEEGSAEYAKLRKSVEKWSKKTPDTPRYKAMGNSMTTYVIEILGRRIQAYDELHYDEVGQGVA